MTQVVSRLRFLRNVMLHVYQYQAKARYYAKKLSAAASAPPKEPKAREPKPQLEVPFRFRGMFERLSQRVIRWLIDNESRIDAIEPEADSVWVYAAKGWRIAGEDQHCWSEATIAQIVAAVKFEPCDCEDCTESEEE